MEFEDVKDFGQKARWKVRFYAPIYIHNHVMIGSFHGVRL